MSVTARVQRIFDKANFIRDLGITVTDVGDGWCETSLSITDRHRQQHGYVHAGVVATMADHTAGGACRSASGERDVITVEFKINFFRPATGDRLRCRAQVLRAGKSIIVAEAEVFSVESAGEKLVAKLTETCAVIEQK
jgi:uncharacterized protein (TIGR00369 family)